MKKKNILILFCLSLGFTILNFVRFEYSCKTDELWPKFYGFPFVQWTDTTWVNSMSGDFFLKGFLCNVLFWFAFFYLVIHLLNSIQHKIFKKIINTIIIFLCLFSLIIIYFEFTVFDWRFNWDHNNFKLDYYQEELDCVRTFHFFN